MINTVHTAASDVRAQVAAGLARRHRRERRFRRKGQLAIAFALLMLGVLLLSIASTGAPGFIRHEVRLDIPVTELQNKGQPLDYYAITKAALLQSAGQEVIETGLRHQLLSLSGTFAALELRDQLADQALPTKGTVSVWVPLSSSADLALKHPAQSNTPDAERQLTARQYSWLLHWQAAGRIRARVNIPFLLHGDSRAPEAASLGASIVGSLLTLLICLGVALPIALMAAITLEEFARKSRLAEWIEITINNLAAVPSIIYGLLGLSIFLQVLELPRSSALVGGLTLAMLILPVMIIATRAAIRAVPPSMRQAATALGATPLQVVRHHVLPYAWPGIMTGTILSICRALGETAPLLMIGMVAFVADVPRGFTDPSTTMPVQVYLWASSPEQGFLEKTSAGILVLLVILLILNMAAIRLRTRSQLTWN